MQAAIGRVRRFGVGLATVACVFGLAGSASAQEVDCATIRWNAAAGPVVGYEIFVEINGGDVRFYDRVDASQASISGPEFQVGDALRFQVRAYAADGRVGPLSSFSDTVFCQSIPTPQGISAEDGSIRNPNLLWWDPVDYAEFYVVFRSPQPGAAGSFLASSEDPFFEDATAELGVEYEYVVAAVAGRQVSTFTPAVRATRRGTPPQLVASQTSLQYSAGWDETSGQQQIELSNAGDGEIAYQAWSGARWLTVSPAVGVVDGVAQPLTLHYDIGSLSGGEYHGLVRIYGYYDPLPGQESPTPTPLEIAVDLTVPPDNRPPTFETSLDVSALEGTTTTVTLRASDPDEGDLIDIGVGGGLPSWVRFESLGGGEGRLVISPGYEAAGVYTGLAAAWDNGVPAAVTVETLTITVQDVNRSPVLSSVAPQTVRVGETLVVPLSAVDPDVGDQLAFSTSSKPDFVTLEPLGGGLAQLVVEPTSAADVGSWLLVVAVVDDGSPPGFNATSVQITVEQ